MVLYHVGACRGSLWSLALLGLQDMWVTAVNYFFFVFQSVDEQPFFKCCLFL